VTEREDIVSILTERDRTLVAAWTLPREGPLTDAERRAAMENFAAYIGKVGLTPAQIVDRLGSPRKMTLRALLDGHFREHGVGADVHIRRLNDWVEQDARQRLAAMPERFVETKIAKDLESIARIVRENVTMGLACGPSGIGKTRCAEALARKYVGAVYLRIVTGYATPRGLIHALASHAAAHQGAYWRRAGQRMSLERTIAALRGSGVFLIIDEAQKLDDDALEVLRDVHDSCAVPVLCLATKDLHDRIVRTADADHGQLYSRFDVIHHLTQGLDVLKGGKPLFTIEDILALYVDTPIRLSMDAARYLQDVANYLGRGSLRRCRILLQNAVRIARRRAGVAESESVTVVADDLAWVETHLRSDMGEQESARARLNRSALAG